ncbi:DUF3987 domain-containing protein [Desulfovibrio subterraneus]|uniref:Toprim domain-containing protein n=1 Tax=Desulfovibrio subterraneus TaxID=2718620 RepID=A0A7J0BJ51_9BACT|nr:DUF3987 domain-containing protein [Desulfovibrio subterraneus]GFM33726.1 hypothetical protein DSM101010T_20910 [Desulfovibrio subterraneus]
MIARNRESSNYFDFRNAAPYYDANMRAGFHEDWTLEDARRQLHAKIHALGLECPEIVADGEFHRCDIQSDLSGMNDGSYWLSPEFPYCGYAKNWKSGEEEKVSPAEDVMSTFSSKQREAFEKEQTHFKKLQVVELAKRAETMAERALSIMQECVPARPDHPYLLRKRVKAYGLYQDKGGRLVIPLVDTSGKIWGWQTIEGVTNTGHPEKRCHGSKKGHYFGIGLPDGNEPPRVLYIAEGYATAASIHEATGSPIVMAVDAGNLMSVGRALREKYPDAFCVFCADNDAWTEGNPGRAYAQKAAHEIRGTVCLPEFEDTSLRPTDFNDLHMLQGLSAVRMQIQQSVVEAISAGTVQPIPIDAPQPLPITSEMLPAVLWSWVEECAKSVQVPLELVVANTLGALSAAVFGRCFVRLGQDYVEPLCLFIMAPLPPGERKSSVTKLCKAPLVVWEREKQREEAFEVRKNRRRVEAINGQIKEIEKEMRNADLVDMDEYLERIERLERDKPKKLTTFRLFADDVTAEGLALLMSQNHEQCAIIEAEGGFLETIGGRYSAGVANLDLVLKAYNKESVNVDRRGSDSLKLESPALTMCISPQIFALRGLAAKPDFRSRGVVGRFIFLMGKSTLGTRTPYNEDIPLSIVQQYWALVCRQAEDMYALVKAGKEIELTCSKQGMEELNAFRAEVEVRMGPEGDLHHMTDWAGKIPGTVVRIAGLYHLIERLSNDQREIQENSVRMACQFGRVLIGHAKVALSVMEGDERGSSSQFMLEKIRQMGIREVSLRDIFIACRSRFAKMGKCREIVGFLEEHGYLAKTTPSLRGVGRKSELYVVHPSVFIANSCSQNTQN